MTIERAGEALGHIDPVDREIWIRMGMALQDEFGAAGFDPWNRWSAQAPNYKARDALAAWRGFRTGRVTIASLYWLAKQNGWAPDSDPLYKDPQVVARRRREHREREQREAQRKRREADRAAKEVTSIVSASEWKEHEYLAAKGFPGKIGKVRSDGALIVPVWNPAGIMRSAQYIQPDGTKRFHPRGEIKGNAHRIGRSHEVWLCEGFATGLSIFEALRARFIAAEVRVCLSASNLKTVGLGCEEAGMKVFSVTDHDKSGVGAKAATEAGWPWWQPPTEGDDANDFHCKDSLDALADALRAFRLTEGARE